MGLDSTGSETQIVSSAVSEIEQAVPAPSTFFDRANYGNDFQTHLMEQYKLCVDMADRVSARRSSVNTFYISLLSALLAFLSLIVDKALFSESINSVLFFTAILGIILCFTWYLNIQSYRRLNSLKFAVINEMEQQLPYPCFIREWEILKERQKSGRQQYIRLTTVEKTIPLIFSVPYIGLFLKTLFSF